MVKHLLLALLICLTIFEGTVVCGRKRAPVKTENGYLVGLKKIVCSNSTERVIFDVCKIKQIRGKTGQISIGLTVVNIEKKVFLRSQVELQTGANTYVPTPIDITFDLCEVAKSEQAMGAIDGLLNMFSPQTKMFMSPFLHPCPYQGRHESLNFTFDKMMIPPFITGGDVRAIGTVLDGAMEQLIQVTIYFYIKNDEN